MNDDKESEKEREIMEQRKLDREIMEQRKRTGIMISCLIPLWILAVLTFFYNGFRWELLVMLVITTLRPLTYLLFRRKEQTND